MTRRSGVGRRRRRIPSRIVDDVLFQSDHTCCICRTKGKDVQLHHIDGRPSNCAAENLATVCLDCHAKVSRGRGLGRSYGAGEVRRYKRSWERAVRDARGVHRPAVQYKRELISQIDLVVCDILVQRANARRTQELLNLLYELHLWRGEPAIDNRIVDGLDHLAVMSGLSSPGLAAMVADKLWEMCWHFVGPDRVPMGRAGEKFVLRCLAALRTLAEFNSEFGHGRKAAEVIPTRLENFFEVGIWYGSKPITTATLRAYRAALKACQSDGAFVPGRRALRESLGRLSRMLPKDKTAWRGQRRIVDNLLVM